MPIHWSEGPLSFIITFFISSSPKFLSAVIMHLTPADELMISYRIVINLKDQCRTHASIPRGHKEKQRQCIRVYSLIHVHDDNHSFSCSMLSPTGQRTLPPCPISPQPPLCSSQNPRKSSERMSTTWTSRTTKNIFILRHSSSSQLPKPDVFMAGCPWTSPKACF